MVIDIESFVAYTISASAITDAVRANSTSALGGDGRLGDGSVGLWHASENLGSGDPSYINTTDSSEITGNYTYRLYCTNANLSVVTLPEATPLFGTDLMHASCGGTSATLTTPRTEFMGLSNQTVVGSFFIKVTDVAMATLSVDVVYMNSSVETSRNSTEISLSPGNYSRHFFSIKTTIAMYAIQFKMEINSSSPIFMLVDGVQSEVGEEFATPYIPNFPVSDYPGRRDASSMKFNVLCEDIRIQDAWLALRFRVGGAGNGKLRFPVLSWFKDTKQGLYLEYMQGRARAFVYAPSEVSSDIVDPNLQTDSYITFIVAPQSTGIGFYTSHDRNSALLSTSVTHPGWSNNINVSTLNHMITIGMAQENPNSGSSSFSEALDGDLFYFAIGRGALNSTDIDFITTLTNNIDPFAVKSKIPSLVYIWGAGPFQMFESCPSLLTPTPAPTPTPSPPTCELMRGLNLQCSGDTYTVTASSHSPKLHFINYSFHDSFLLATTISVPDSSVEINGSVTVSGTVLELHLQNASVSVSGDLRLQAGTSWLMGNTPSKFK